MEDQYKFFFKTPEYSTLYGRQQNQQTNLDQYFKDPVLSYSLFDVEQPQSQILSEIQTFKYEFKWFQRCQKNMINSNVQQKLQNPKNQKLKIKKQHKRQRRIFKKSKNSPKKQLVKSQITKNACCYIVHKAISIIKHGNYLQKLQQICLNERLELQQFKQFILAEKNRFTGSKAFQNFLQNKQAKYIVFAKFLKWFLTQKYIRHALQNGEMNNIHAYIKFKNEFMLPLL